MSTFLSAFTEHDMQDQLTGPGAPLANPSAAVEHPAFTDYHRALVRDAVASGLTPHCERAPDGSGVVVIGGAHPSGGRFGFGATTRGERWSRVDGDGHVQRRKGTLARTAIQAVFARLQGYGRPRVVWPEQPADLAPHAVPPRFRSSPAKHTDPVDGPVVRWCERELKGEDHGHPGLGVVPTFRVVGRGWCASDECTQVFNGGTAPTKTNTYSTESGLRCCACNGTAYTTAGDARGAQ